MTEAESLRAIKALSDKDLLKAYNAAGVEGPEQDELAEEIGRRDLDL